MRPHPAPCALAGACLAVLLSVTGCGGTSGAGTAGGTPTSVAPTSGTPTTRTSTASPSSTAPSGSIRLGDLGAGSAPTADYLAGGTLRFDGTSVTTDLPDDVTQLDLMGRVGDLVVVQGFEKAIGFWSIDGSGHATELGRGPYDVYNYAPQLVPATGHLWINYNDRGTARNTIWEIDVRSGRQLLQLDGAEAPPHLAPADQAVYDLYRGHSDAAAAPPPATSPDGTLQAAVDDEVQRGQEHESVVVRRVDDHSVVLRERIAPDALPPGAEQSEVYVDEVVFEDDDHVLMRVSTVTGDYGNVDTTEHAAVVRCDLHRVCERATDLYDSVAVGVDPGAQLP